MFLNNNTHKRQKTNNYENEIQYAYVNLYPYMYLHELMNFYNIISYIQGDMHIFISSIEKTKQISNYFFTKRK